MFVKLPTWLSTLRKASGRCQATVNAQMPPEEMPQIARHSGSSVSLYSLADFGQDFLQQEPGILVAERVVLEAAVAGLPRL